MNNPRQSMRLGLVALIGMSIVLGGWLTTGPVALAEEEGHGNAVRVLADRIAGAQLTLVQAIQAAEQATGGVDVLGPDLHRDQRRLAGAGKRAGERHAETDFDRLLGPDRRRDKRQGQECRADQRC